MKTSDAFKKTIKSYLEQRAKEDELFAVSYAKESKNINECCNFILQQVQKSGCNGFNDEEIYSMAVHYYPKYIVIRSVQFIIVDIQLIGSTTC